MLLWWFIYNHLLISPHFFLFLHEVFNLDCIFWAMDLAACPYPLNLASSHWSRNSGNSVLWQIYCPILPLLDPIRVAKCIILDVKNCELLRKQKIKAIWSMVLKKILQMYVITLVTWQLEVSCLEMVVSHNVKWMFELSGKLTFNSTLWKMKRFQFGSKILETLEVFKTS